MLLEKERRLSEKGEKKEWSKERGNWEEYRQKKKR